MAAMTKCRKMQNGNFRKILAITDKHNLHNVIVENCNEISL